MFTQDISMLHTVEDGSRFSFSLSLPNDSFDRREVFNQKCMRVKTEFLMNHSQLLLTHEQNVR